MKELRNWISWRI